jgi:hypothetical protein
VAGTEATGSIDRNIAAALLIATGQQQIVSAGRLAVIHSPTVRGAHGNNSVARAEISGAIAEEEAPASAIELAVGALETGRAAEQTASAAAIFRVVVEVAAMHSEAVREATTAPALAQIAAADPPAWDPGAEAEGSAAAVVAVAVAAGDAGKESRTTLPGA